MAGSGAGYNEDDYYIMEENDIGKLVNLWPCSKEVTIFVDDSINVDPDQREDGRRAYFSENGISLSWDKLIDSFIETQKDGHRSGRVGDIYDKDLESEFLLMEARLLGLIKQISKERASLRYEKCSCEKVLVLK